MLPLYCDFSGFFHDDYYEVSYVPVQEKPNRKKNRKLSRQLRRLRKIK